MKSQEESDPKKSASPAAQHVADAHQLLKAMQAKLAQHPELDEAIRKLELALSALTVQTGGMI